MPSGAKARERPANHGTGEPVPFRDRLLTQENVRTRTIPGSTVHTGKCPNPYPSGIDCPHGKMSEPVPFRDRLSTQENVWNRGRPDRMLIQPCPPGHNFSHRLLLSGRFRFIKRFGYPLHTRPALHPVVIPIGLASQGIGQFRRPPS